MTTYERQPDDPNKHPIGHPGYCCDACIEESNMGYSGFDSDTCCCRDVREPEQQRAEYEAYLKGPES